MTLPFTQIAHQLHVPEMLAFCLQEANLKHIETQQGKVFVFFFKRSIQVKCKLLRKKCVLFVFFLNKRESTLMIPGLCNVMICSALMRRKTTSSLNNAVLSLEGAESAA